MGSYPMRILPRLKVIKEHDGIVVSRCKDKDEIITCIRGKDSRATIFEIRVVDGAIYVYRFMWLPRKINFKGKDGDWDVRVVRNMGDEKSTILYYMKLGAELYKRRDARGVLPY